MKDVKSLPKEYIKLQKNETYLRGMGKKRESLNDFTNDKIILNGLNYLTLF